MLSPEARRQIEQADRRNRGKAWMAGDSELVDPAFGARHTDRIDVGCEIWSHEAGPTPEEAGMRTLSAGSSSPSNRAAGT